MAKPNPISELNCAAAAESVIPLVLQAQLQAMCKLRRRALDWGDPEGVHAMRVCSRRLRSAMSDFRPFVRASLPRVKLRRIADALGAVRDLDVALIALDQLGKQAKGEAAEGIQIIADEFRGRRKHARTKLKTAIRPAVIDEFRNEFHHGLNELRISKRSAAKTVAPAITLRDIARDIIFERIKEVRAASHQLYFPFHIKELHELRILAKRLRYAVELFSECWQPKLRPVAKEISLLQTSLGELHDCDSWIEALSARLKDGERKHHSDVKDVRVRAGATWLLRHFAGTRMEHYRAALVRWQEWTANNFLLNLESVVAEIYEQTQARGTPKV
jgi:CHAD domain-containing protein